MRDPGFFDELPVAREQAPDREAEWTARIIHTLAAEMESAPGPTLRGGHAKSHGTLEAELVVESGLPAEIAVGVLAEPRTYRAWVRLSNAMGSVQPDTKKDIRGLAIKLLSPEPGAMLAPFQDFVLVSDPSMIFADLEQFWRILDGVMNSKLRLAWFLLSHPRNALAVLRRGSDAPHPLSIPYFSATPYRLNRWAVKYRVHPTEPLEAEQDDSDDRLRAALKATLSKRAVDLELGVQFQTDEGAMPIENSMVAWDPKHSPVHRVATLHIPRQSFDTAERDAFGEALEISPWHCLEPHRPLGGVNRGRRTIYQALAALRRERNRPLLEASR